MKAFALMIFNILICCTIGVKLIVTKKKFGCLSKKMEDKWNAHGYSFSGGNNPFVPEAILINPVGMYWKNRAEIIKGIQTFGDIRFKHESTKYNKVDVRFLAPTVALVIIQLQIRLMRTIICQMELRAVPKEKLMKV